MKYRLQNFRFLNKSILIHIWFLNKSNSIFSGLPVNPSITSENDEDEDRIHLESRELEKKIRKRL